MHLALGNDPVDVLMWAYFQGMTLGHISLSTMIQLHHHRLGLQVSLKFIQQWLLLRIDLGQSQSLSALSLGSPK